MIGWKKKNLSFQWPSWGFKLWFGDWGNCSKLKQSLFLNEGSDFGSQSWSFQMTHVNDRYKMWCPLKWNSVMEHSTFLWGLIQWFYNTLFQFNNKPIKLPLFILKLWKLPLLQFSLCRGYFRIPRCILPGKWRCWGGSPGFIHFFFFFAWSPSLLLLQFICSYPRYHCLELERKGNIFI